MPETSAKTWPASARSASELLAIPATTSTARMPRPIPIAAASRFVWRPAAECECPTGPSVPRPTARTAPAAPATPQCDSRDTLDPLEPTRKSRSAPRVGLHGRGRRRGAPSRASGWRRRRPRPRSASRAASSSAADVDVRRRSATSRLDPIAGLHQGERAAGRGLGRDMQHDRAVRGAAHPPVADPDHVAHALCEQLLGQRHVRDLGHPRVALRAAAAEHHHRVLVDVEIGVVDPRVEVLDRVEHDRPAAVLSRCRSAAAGLMSAPAGARFRAGRRSRRSAGPGASRAG